MKFKNIYVLIIVIVSLLFSINCIGQGLYQGSTEKKYYTEISYEYVNEKIIIPVEIEGEIYRFLLDTGAPNMISFKLKDKNKTDFLKKIQVTDANNIKSSLEMVSIPDLKIGGISFKNTTSLVMNKAPNLIFDCFQIDGSIGSNLLQNSIIQILPQRKIIKLTNLKKRLSLNRKQAVKIELKGDQKSPFLWIKVKANSDAREQVLFDTGKKGFYDLSKKHFNFFQKDSILNISAEGYGSMATGFFGEEEKSNHYKVLIPKIIINNSIFLNVSAQTNNGLFSKLGTEILKYGNVTIDFKNKKFYYEPFKNGVEVNLSKSSFGFNLAVVENKLIVGIIWSESLKEKINYGDQIIEINGIDYTTFDLCDLIAKVTFFHTYDHIEIVVLTTNGEQKKLNLTKATPKKQ